MRLGVPRPVGSEVIGGWSCPSRRRRWSNRPGCAVRAGARWAGERGEPVAWRGRLPAEDEVASGRGAQLNALLQGAAFVAGFEVIETDRQADEQKGTGIAQ